MGQSFTVNMCLLHSFTKRSCKQYLHQSSMQQHVWRFLKALATSWKRRPYLSCKFSPTSHSWEVRACSTGIQNLESYNNLIAALHPTSNASPRHRSAKHSSTSQLLEHSQTAFSNTSLQLYITPFFSISLSLYHNTSSPFFL